MTAKHLPSRPESCRSQELIGQRPISNNVTMRGVSYDWAILNMIPMSLPSHLTLRPLKVVVLGSSDQLKTLLTDFDRLLARSSRTIYRILEEYLSTVMCVLMYSAWESRKNACHLMTVSTLTDREVQSTRIHDGSTLGYMPSCGIFLSFFRRMVSDKSYLFSAMLPVPLVSLAF